MLFLIISFLVHGQNKNIVINDSLSSTAKKYNLNTSKLKNIKFGDYHIIKARPKWIISTSHTSLFR